MGISVTIIDDSDFAGTAAAIVRGGELTMTSVADMVARIVSHLARHAPPPVGTGAGGGHATMAPGRRPVPATAPAPRTALMSRLNVLDHGNPSRLQIGTDRINTGNFATFEASLATLRPLFDVDGFAHLQHCEVGQNLRLMEMFADCWGVPIVAGRGYHNPIYRANTGNYVRVYPAGAGGTRRANDTFFWGPSGQ